MPEHAAAPEMIDRMRLQFAVRGGQSGDQAACFTSWKAHFEINLSLSQRVGFVRR